MQHEITRPQKLLDENGNIAEPGYAKKLLWQYSRDDVKAPKIRIKEWDYYYIGTQDYGICLTISDAGYVGTVSASILRFGNGPRQMNGAQIKLFPMGSVNLPPTSEKGDIHARAGTADFTFENNGSERRLYGSFDNYCNTKKALIFDIRLTEIPPESMVIATPFDKKAHFYYNQKINCMRAEGFLNMTENAAFSAVKTAHSQRLTGAGAFGLMIIRGSGARGRRCLKTVMFSALI